MSKNTQQEIASPESATPVDVADKEMHKDKRAVSEKEPYFSAKRLAKLATFVALALVMKIIGKSLTLTPTMTVTFIYLPWLVSGASLGVFGGMVVGAISDVLGNLLFGSPFVPLTFLSNTIYPIFIALLYKTPIRNDYIKCTIGAFSSLIVCTLGIGSVALYTFYGYVETMNFFEYMIAYRLPQVVVFAVNYALLLALVKPLQNVGIFPKAKSEKTNRAFVFGVNTALITALAVASIIVSLVSGVAETNPWFYLLIGEIYVALVLLSAFVIVDKSRAKLAKSLFTAFLGSACAFTLTAVLIVPNFDVILKSALSIVTCLVCVTLAIIVIIRKPKNVG